MMSPTAVRVARISGGAVGVGVGEVVGEGVGVGERAGVGEDTFEDTFEDTVEDADEIRIGEVVNGLLESELVCPAAALDPSVSKEFPQKRAVRSKAADPYTIRRIFVRGTDFLTFTDSVDSCIPI